MIRRKLISLRRVNMSNKTSGKDIFGVILTAIIVLVTLYMIIPGGLGPLGLMIFFIIVGWAVLQL